MRIVHGIDEARRTLFARRPVGSSDLPPAVRARIAAVFGAELEPEAVVRRIIDDVRTTGDAAVTHYNTVLDGLTEGTGALIVSREEIAAAYGKVEDGLAETLRFAADRIRRYHEQQRTHAATTFTEGGIGQLVRPLDRVGVYVPGTAVVYPSSVLMTALPARVAGVREVIMASPAGPDGHVSPIKLIAADVAGVDMVVNAGGAQAVAALAYGTASIPAVDKICGPGGLFVTLAKRAVYGDVGIDALYGPSETIVVADDSADPMLCAADMLAQAEHDELATPLLVTTSAALAEEVGREVERQLALLPRAAVARAAFDARGGAAVVVTLEEAMALANEYAAEHLCLLLRDPQAALPLVRNAGGVFVGEISPESLGDYTAGPSHVMPTGGSARFASPLGVHDFLKVTSVVAVDEVGLRANGPAAARLARYEGFVAHARSIELRLDGGERS